METTLSRPQSSGIQEPRRWPRYHFDVPVRLIIAKLDKKRIVTAHGRELSGGGMRVATRTEVQVGDQLQLEFVTPMLGLPVRVRAAVRNRIGSYVGLEFLSATRDEELEVELLRQTLISYARQSSSRYFP